MEHKLVPKFDLMLVGLSDNMSQLLTNPGTCFLTQQMQMGIEAALLLLSRIWFNGKSQQ
jgi:hypothetical protein